MLWALSDSSGLPAKRFADLDPVPSLDWLKPLSDDRYRKADLSHFGLTSHADEDNQLTFSLINRPSPPTSLPWMTIVDHGSGTSAWDGIMFHLARWLTRHLDDPALVLWLAENGGWLHPEFAQLVARKMEEFDDSDAGDLRRIRANAPRAVPRPLMRTLWRLLLTGRVKTSRQTFDIFRWIRRFRHDGLTATLRLQLREVLTPRLLLREPLPSFEDREDRGKSEQLDDLVYWEVVLSSDYVHSKLGDLRKDPLWTKALPGLLDDFSTLLRDAMDLMGELGGADDRYDPSIVWQPSISVHSQNTVLRDWTVLIDLTRDAWLETVEAAPETARLAAEAWILAPYPVFRRLAYFAAAHQGVVPARQGLNWLLRDDHWWLWAYVTQREAIRLLVALAPGLDTDLAAELEHAVLAGPPRSMYEVGIEPERWKKIVECGVWLRLAKMDDAGATLSSDAKARLNELASRHPDWGFGKEDEEEFPIWSGGSDFRTFVATPHRRRELVKWLKQHPGGNDWEYDDWRLRCVNDFPAAVHALSALARDGEWPLARWRDALHVWSDEKLTKCSWRYVRPVLSRAPDDVLLPLAPAVGLWLERVVKGLNGHDPRFLEFCKRMLALEHEVDGDEDDPAGQAINHPVGKITEALLSLCTTSSMEDGQGLSAELKSVFTKLCNVRIAKFQHGRVLLAMSVITLFRVAREWTARHLLPLFDWQRSQSEARAVWEGFFCSPRLYRPLMEVINDFFLNTASHYEKLGRHGAHYPAWLTFAALNLSDTFTTQQLRKATGALPERGLRRAAGALADALEGAGERRTEHWRNRTLPYLRRIWPKSKDRRTPAISESLGRVCIAAQDAFPAAMKELRGWLQPLQYPGVLMHRLKTSELCLRFPETGLDFLHLTISEKVPQMWDVDSCLKQIRTAEPELENDSRFQILRDFLRIRGREM